MWIRTNPNPCGRFVGDCSVRAVAVALDISWEEAFDLLADAAYKMCDMPSSNGVIGAVLRMHGFRMSAIQEPRTVAEFARDNPRGIYVLFKTGEMGHVVTVIDGNAYDAWDSRNELVQFCWYRKDDLT